MANPPAFQLYAADFYMDTVSWPIEAVGIYTRLLFYQWVNGSIPNDEKELARIAGCGVAKLKKNFNFWSTKFTKKDDNNLINERLEKTRNKQLEYKEKQAISGRNGGLKKQENRLKEPSEPTSKPNSDPYSENLALHSSSSTLKNNINKKSLNNNINISETPERPVDNSTPSADTTPPASSENKPEKPAEETPLPLTSDEDYIKRLNEAIKSTREKYPSSFEQREIEKFVQENFSKYNREAIIHCINSLAKVEVKAKHINLWLNAALKTNNGGENGKYNAAQSESDNNRNKSSTIPADILKKIVKPIPDAKVY